MPVLPRARMLPGRLLPPALPSALTPCLAPAPTQGYHPLLPHRLAGHGPTPSGLPGATRLSSFTSLSLSLGPSLMLPLFPKSCLFSYMYYNSEWLYHAPILRRNLEGS